MWHTWAGREAGFSQAADRRLAQQKAVIHETAVSHDRAAARAEWLGTPGQCGGRGEDSVTEEMDLPKSHRPPCSQLQERRGCPTPHSTSGAPSLVFLFASPGLGPEIMTLCKIRI